mmetsp:Transcript_22385/g.40326  ORF Transcript_22385/g.40326 Transcript_22385/m.40326 type:complete len:417 (-) Transcript_22385:147-1397(-)
MATYINYGEGEEDATVQGAEWLTHLFEMQQKPDLEKAFTTKFKAVQAEQENKKEYDYGPVFDLFLEYSQDLFAAIPENRPEERLKDIESFFALVMSMLPQLEDAKQLDEATTQLCEFFSKSTEQQAELRLRLLMMLYNTFNDPTFKFRYRVFKYTIDYAARADLFDQVLPYLDYLDAWMVDWAIKVEEKRGLYSDISKYMRDFGKKVDAFMYLKMYHETFQGETAENLNKKEVMDATIELIKDAVTLPSVIQFDNILVLDTVQALRKTKQDGLVKLCEIFLSGTVEDFKEFQKKHGGIFDEHGLNLEEAMSKIRLLTLATIAKGKSELSLDEVAKRLQEDTGGVEKWVVRGISEGVIDGRIDQLNRKVLVKSTFQRKFEKDEWNFLEGKLSLWIDNLEHVIKFIGEQKVKSEAASA